MAPAPFEVGTPHGPARVHRDPRGGHRGLVVLGHGAGGDVGAPDLVAASSAARAAGFRVALVEQPYRVAGRRSPAPAPQLDEAWLAVVRHLLAAEPGGLPLVVGGRSSGARVACRTATASGASGAICLAFPLRPPRRAGRTPPPSRLSELDGAGVPVLVVQGRSDPFGVPRSRGLRTVVRIDGDHSLRRAGDAVRHAVGEWLDALVSSPATAGARRDVPPTPTPAPRSATEAG